MYKGPGKKNLLKNRPAIIKPTNVIVKVTHTTICGTNLYILKGDVRAIKPSITLDDEGVGLALTIAIVYSLEIPLPLNTSISKLVEKIS